MDLIIRNGRIIDPSNDVDCVGDVAIKAGRIAAIGPGINSTAKEEFDATGCLVTPGLIDLHIHGYQYATPLGINVDEACLSRGVTTVVDAGSAGIMIITYCYANLLRTPPALRHDKYFLWRGKGIVR